MSRPKQDQHRSSTYRIRLYQSEHDRLREVAKQNNMTIADVIRVGVNAIIADEPVFKKEGK